MKERLRTAVGGIRHESNTFSPIWTEYDDFRVEQADALLYGALDPSALPAGVTLCPTFVASAMPGGLVRKAAYLRLKDALLRELGALLPVDGIYLDLHGAMEVEEIGDGEADLVSAIRALAGDEMLISVSLDLHGNISPRLVHNADILTAFRTAPHRDEQATRQRAVALLVRALRENLRPVPALVKLPLLLPGEMATTDVEPARSLYARLAELDGAPGIMNASLLIGCAWTDSAATSTSVIVVAEGDRDLAHAVARRFADEVWARRQDFGFSVEVASVDDAIRRAMSASERPVFLSDSGDNVTAGGAGDSSFMAERLLALEARGALVAGLTDMEAVRDCAAAGIGHGVQLALGGKPNGLPGIPRVVEGIVEHLAFEAEDQSELPAMALVRVDGVRIIFTRARRAFRDRASIAAAGIDPMRQQIVVVKLGYLFPDLADHAPRAIMALSSGATSLRLEELPYRNVPRPIFPLDLE